MKRFVLLPLALLLLGAADPKDEAVRKEQKKLAGKWVLVEAVVDGKKVPAEVVQKGHLVHRGDETTLVTPHQSGEPIKAKSKLDPTTTPKRVDWVRSQGPGAGKTIQAIYEWDGDDKYRVCFDPSGKERPKEFVSKPGSGHILHVWKRATK